MLCCRSFGGRWVLKRTSRGHRHRHLRRHSTYVLASYYSGVRHMHKLLRNLTSVTLMARAHTDPYFCEVWHVTPRHLGGANISWIVINRDAKKKLGATVYNQPNPRAWWLFLFLPCYLIAQKQVTALSSLKRDHTHQMLLYLYYSITHTIRADVASSVDPIWINAILRSLLLKKYKQKKCSFLAASMTIINIVLIVKSTARN